MHKVRLHIFFMNISNLDNKLGSTSDPSHNNTHKSFQQISSNFSLEEPLLLLDQLLNVPSSTKQTTQKIATPTL
jgi:hypothetical protein